MPKTKTVLILEDNPSDADLLMEILDESENYFVAEEHQFKTTWVKNLDDALEKLNSNSFDVVITDLNLGDSDGLETLASIKSNAKDAAIIVSTGFMNRKLWSEALAKGADDYLTKNTLEGNVLIRSICYALERKKFKLATAV